MSGDGARLTLGALAERFGLTLVAGAASTPVAGVCALEPGAPGCIAYADRAGRAQAVTRTRAAAVIATPALADAGAAAVLTTDRPRLAFARVARLFEPAAPAPGVAPSARVDASASIDAAAAIGAHVVVGPDSHVAGGACIEPGCVLGASARIGRDARIGANASIGGNVRVGARTRVEAGAVLGARGFGLVHNGQAWEAVPQLAGVVIGDDAEIGASTTIDRGTLADTVIGRGVKIDDQVHIGHNSDIGAHTVIAGCTGIAGSVTIGANCMIGGGVGIVDHVRIAEGAVITAASQVLRDIDTAGVYSSTLRAMPATIWRRRLALFRRFDWIERRLRRLEQRARKKDNPQ